jgi:hypothetical protein
MSFNTAIRPFSVALDTSALSAVLGDSALRERFVRVVQRRHAAVVISTMVVFEFSSDGDVQRVTAACLALKALCRALPRSLRITPDHKELMRTEGRRVVREQPVLTTGWPDFAALPDAKIAAMATKLPESYEWLRDKKDDLHELDRGLAKFLEEERGYVLEPAVVLEKIKGDGPSSPKDMMIEQAGELTGFPAVQIAANPKRFRTAHVFSQWITRLQFGNSVAADKCKGEAAHVVGMWRTKKDERGRGAWYDAFIAAAASYADVLVTDDTDQARRTMFLRERSLVPFRAETLGAFLGQKQGD